MNSEITKTDQNKAQFAGKVLIVEDQDISLKLLTRHFSQYNFCFDAVNNGADAIDRINRCDDYDLVVLDIMMPKVNGYEVCQRIREKYSLFELPVLFLTAKSATGDLLRGFDVGANDFVTKPYEPEALIARSRTLVRLKRLTATNEQLQEAIKAKNRYLQMNIHDLKNPLNSILMLSELLGKQRSDNEDASQMLGIMHNSANVMLKLINQLLEISKIDSGKISLDKRPCDVDLLLRESVNLNKNSADAKQQQIIIQNVLDSGTTTMGDYDKLLLVFDNLLSNAVKYSPLGGEIMVCGKSVSVSGRKLIRVDIIDQGPGLSENDLKVAFGEFAKLSAQPTAGESSTGLGLYIAKSFVEMHGGSISAENNPPMGSKFTVELEVGSSQAVPF